VKIQDKRQIENTDNIETKHHPEKANDSLTRSGTECLIAVPIWQQWVSKGLALKTTLCGCSCKLHRNVTDAVSLALEIGEGVRVVVAVTGASRLTHMNLNDTKTAS